MKYLSLKALYVMLAVMLVAAVPVAPSYGSESGDCPSIIRPLTDEDPPDGNGGC